MTPDEARRLANGYAWGREDSGAGPTAIPAGALSTPVMEFSEAYAAGWDDYNAGRRNSMIPVRDAYAHWQASGGRAVFERGDLTLTEAQRALLHRLWYEATDPRKPAYYRMRESMQAIAWTALTHDGVTDAELAATPAALAEAEAPEPSLKMGGPR